jgi:hypothetical protein
MDEVDMKVQAIWLSLLCGMNATACVKAKNDARSRQPALGATENKRHADDGEDVAAGDEDADGAGSTPAKAEPQRSYKPLAAALTNEQILDWAAADRAKRGEDAKFFRYAYIPEAFLKDPKDANYARIGLVKGLNCVAIDADDIVNLEDASDGHGALFAIDVRKLWGAKGEQKWDIAARAVPKDVFSPAPRLDLRPFEGNAPVSADRLVYNVLHGGIYDQLVDTPDQGQQLIRNIGAKDVTARSAVKNAITFSPRYIQRRQLPNRPGAYWESFDDFDGNLRELPWVSGRSVPQFRFDGMLADFNTVASEAWMHMKNGLPVYYIWGNANQERTKAEQSFVIDPLNHKGNDLLTGVSCIQCHISGVQASPNDMATAVEQGRVTRDVEAARAFWTPNDELSKQYAEDRRIVIDALRKIVTGVSDGDAQFNEDLVNGVDEHEPTFFLTSALTKNPLRGDTHGYRRRDKDGKLPALGRN